MCSIMEYPRALPYESTRFTGIRAVKGRLTRQRQTGRLEIILDHHYTTRVYNSGSTISGELTINPKHNSSCENVRIMLVGRCRVRQEDINNTALKYHTFLTLDMPISPADHPPNGVLSANTLHKIPFRFVVPQTLLPSACSHPVECESAKSHHACLPPTMGDWASDDMAPSMTKIKYEIVAQVNQHGSAMETRKHLRILSSSPGRNGLDIPKKSKPVTKTKPIQKKAFSKPTGHITFKAGEATTILLSPDAREATPSLITVDIEFTPASKDVSPPKMDSTSAKIHAHTWYSGTPMANFPDRHSISKHYSTTASMAVETTDDSSWTQRGVLDTDEHIESSCTRRLQLALTPPTRDKTFLPTFHSCLVSRTYNMVVSFRVNRESVTLEIPVRIQAEGEDFLLGEDELPSFEEALHFV